MICHRWWTLSARETSTRRAPTSHRQHLHLFPANIHNFPGLGIVTSTREHPTWVGVAYGTARVGVIHPGELSLNHMKPYNQSIIALQPKLCWLSKLE
jgi:hypothetical protein